MRKPTLYFRDWMLQEGMGAQEYTPPNDARQLMMDFYALNMMSNHKVENDPAAENPTQERERDLYANIHHAYQRLVPYLREHILTVLSNSLLSEIRHYPDMDSLENEDFYDELVDAFDRRGTSDPMPFEELEPLVEEMERLFKDYGWKSSYGGKRWSQACTAWLRLYRAHSIPEMSVWIDHIYDLQHNTGNILNKNATYQGSWVSTALDFKRDANELEDYVRYVSPWVRNLLLRMTYSTKRKGYDQDAYGDMHDRPNPAPFKHGGWSTDFSSGVGGEDDEDEDDQYERNQAKKDEVDIDCNHWNSKMVYCTVRYNAEEYGYGGELNFDYSTLMQIALDKSEFEGAPKDINDWEEDGELDHFLDENGYTTGEDGVESENSEDTMLFTLHLPSDSGDSPYEFSTYCQKMYDDWDEHHDDIQNLIRGYFRLHGYMPSTASRDLIASHDPDPEAPSPWKHFEWDYEDGAGKFEVTCQEPIGVSHFFDDKEARGGFLMEETIRRLIAQRIEAYNRTNKQQQHFQGMEPEEKTVPDIDFLTVEFKSTGDENPIAQQADGKYSQPSGGRKFNIIIKMGVDDSHTPDQVKEFQTLVGMVDDMMPQILPLAAHLLADYDRQYAAFTQKNGYEMPNSRSSYGSWQSHRYHDDKHGHFFRFANPWQDEEGRWTPLQVANKGVGVTPWDADSMAASAAQWQDEEEKKRQGAA